MQPRQSQTDKYSSFDLCIDYRDSSKYFIFVYRIGSTTVLLCSKYKIKFLIQVSDVHLSYMCNYNIK